MGLSVKVDPIDKDIAIIINETLSPAARSAAFADFARTQLKEGEEINRSVLGRVPPHKTFVDGSEGQSEDRVRPNGVIQYEFELLGDLFVWIAEQLQKHSPVLTGRYQRSFTFYADGNEVDVGGTIPGDAREFVFVNTQPYARKIERWDGVFEGVAVLARQRFGNQAKIGFGFRSPMGGAFLTGRAGNRADSRTPAIIITLR